MKDRAFLIHYARVMLAEASRRRHGHINRDFYWTLVSAAQRARREASAASDPQGALFA